MLYYNRDLVMVYSDGGIGDRLKTIYNGLCVAKNTHKKMILNWATGNHCTMQFHEMFDNPYTITKEKFKESQFVNFYNSIKGSIFLDVNIGFYCKRPYISFDDFLKSIGSMKVNEKFKMQAEKNLERMQISECDYGFTIRQSDRADKFKLSNQMKILSDLVKKHNGCKIFVTSDELQAELFAKSEFPNNVVIRDKVFPYWDGETKTLFRTKQSLEDSWIDLLMLTKTKFIQCREHYSGFSEAIRYIPQSIEQDPVEITLCNRNNMIF